jgi:hypothetical protein
LLNTDFALIDSAVSGVLNLSVAGGSNVILTSTSGQADQARNRTFVLTGALTANITVFWPNSLARDFKVNNQTTGAFTLTVAVNNGSGSAAGTVYAVPQGKISLLSSDGTNITQQITDGSQLTGLMAVNSFNTRTGAVTLTSGDVTTALGYTPLPTQTVVNSFNTRSGAVTLTNDSGYITGINSTMVVNALGYTPVNPVSLGTAAYTASSAYDAAGTASSAVAGLASSLKTVGGIPSFILVQGAAGAYTLGGSYSGSSFSQPGTWTCMGSVQVEAPGGFGSIAVVMLVRVS